MIGIFILAALSGAGLYAYLQLPKFGALPEGKRLERIRLSPNFRDGEFKNLDPIPPRRGNVVQGWTRMMLTKKDRPRPDFPVPSVKTDMKALDREAPLAIWLGHASYFFQSGGKRFLIDPVFNTHASPFPFVNRAFDGTMAYTSEDMPEIDYLLITHDHWDHLDYPTVMALEDKVGAIVVPLGVGAHLERWEINEGKIHELDWGDSVRIDEETVLYALPALHYSSRLLARNQTLWAAYALISPERKLYMGGDSGYGSHLKAAGEAFDGFDVAFLDSGQYNEGWRWIHKMPEDVFLAAADLKAKAIFPVHMGKFSQAYHSWDDPFLRLVKASVKAGEEQPYALIMPIPGEIVPLDEPRTYISGWWNRKLLSPVQNP
ncbi:MAG: MBL fold metallo-hydrolase [Deltaproteobacteria bacterium]|nr:MBL fold metallo-hydrolase [Deltaproteobacteria bacterium]